VASSFLKSDKNRIGSRYKKTIYKEYRDGSYIDEVAQPAWLGFLGPVLQAEVGDVILIHLKNFATRPYTIHPHGVFYEKDSEGKPAHPFFLLPPNTAFPLWPSEEQELVPRIASFLKTRSHYITQARLKLTFFLCQTLKFWDHRHVPPCLTKSSLSYLLI
jgi:hypothetical protein